MRETSQWPREVDSLETRRILLGFLDEGEAIQALGQAYQLEHPSWGEGLTEGEIKEEQARLEGEFRGTWEEAVDSVGDARPFRDDAINVGPIDAGEEGGQYLDEVRGSSEVSGITDGLDEDAWTLGTVPVGSLVCIQKTVETSAYQDLPTWETDPLQLLKFCLPIDDRVGVRTQEINADDAIVGWQFVSRNPNLQLAGGNITQGPDEGLQVSFTIQAKTNLVQVVHYGDRYILKNGYHRAYRLMKNGVDRVPALVREGDQFADTGGMNGNFFGEDLVMGSRPPLMADFESSAAEEVAHPATNKVVRVLAETTSILR